MSFRNLNWGAGFFYVCLMFVLLHSAQSAQAQSQTQEARGEQTKREQANGVVATTGLITVQATHQLRISLINGNNCVLRQQVRIRVRNADRTVLLEESGFVSQGNPLVIDVAPSTAAASSALQVEAAVGPRPIDPPTLCPINMTVQTLSPNGDDDGCAIGCSGLDLCTYVAGTPGGLATRLPCSPGRGQGSGVQANCTVEPANLAAP